MVVLEVTHELDQAKCLVDLKHSLARMSSAECAVCMGLATTLAMLIVCYQLCCRACHTKTGRREVAGDEAVSADAADGCTSKA